MVRAHTCRRPARRLPNGADRNPYPPLPALLAAPLTLLSLKSAGLVVMAILVLVALSIPGVLGVRDWRCYCVLLMWPPVISAIQTGNVTLSVFLRRSPRR